MKRVTLLAAVAACAPAWKHTPHDQLFQTEHRRGLIRSPQDSPEADWWNRGEMLFVRPLGRALSPGTYVKALLGGPPARDVNRLGQVPDSPWFENRISRRNYSVQEVFDGAAGDTGFAPGELSVISGKIDGVSAGFVVRDTAGQVWYLKLDHPGFPQISTSAETIASRLLWLAGYRVPSMKAFDVDRGRFVLDPKAHMKDRYSRSVPMTPAYLAELLANTNPDLENRIRVLMSRQAKGKVLGPFDYRGQRVDDRNDTIPHEHRRSLRALWLFAAWVNNTDTRSNNTLDMFVPLAPDGSGIVEHYLIDFGDSFGATGLGEKALKEGWEYLLDWPVVITNLFGFGLRTPDYEHAKRSPLRSVGLFESKVFDPTSWKPGLPNPAFDQRTSADLFWAASILARIQAEHVRAAVGAGSYKEEGAAEYVVATLLERRQKLLEYGFGTFLELDRPRGAGLTLRLDDLRVLGGLTHQGEIQYVVRWNRTRAFDVELASGSVPANTPELSIDLTQAIAARRGDFGDDPFITVLLKRHGRQLEVHLRVSADRVIPVAVER
ncbi:MAG: hypothetical protein ABI867_17380 [Kofleriaceae bacterium]